MNTWHHNLATDAQLKYILTLQTELEIDPIETEILTKGQASSIISELLNKRKSL